MKTLLQTLLKAIALIPVIMLLNSGPALADSFEKQLKRRGIVVAYVDDARPLCFPDQNGEPQGLVVDLWKVWSKKTGISVRLALAPWKEAVLMVRQGKADVFGGLVKDEERERWLSFSKPIFKVRTVLIAKAGSGLDEEYFAREGMVGVIKGTRAEKLHHEFLPKGSVKTYPRSRDLIKGFSEGEVDGLVTYLPTFTMTNQKLERPVSHEILTVLDESSIRMAVRKGDENLLKVIDKGFALISDREKRIIQDRWFVQDLAKEETKGIWYWVWGIFLLMGIAYLILRMTRHPKH